MGLSLSLHLSSWSRTLRQRVFDLTDNVETVIARSISFGSQEGGEMISNSNKLNLDKQSLEKNEKQKLELPAPLQELVISGDDETSLQPFDHHPSETDRGFRLPPPPPAGEAFVFSSPRPICELDHAATKLQKVYKSYRTRRNLADCAVVVEELWWKALDCAALNRSSITFFTNNEPESAASRWDRAKLRAAKVGKGLLKDEKAQKLALHHWLEAIDPRHRYGRNLHFYYDVWFERKSYQPFFYWLDIGDGKEVNLPSCPRTDLQRQCIQYLGPVEREVYQVVVVEGRLVYKKSGLLLNTDEKSKWIFVLSTARCLYVAEKKKGKFQHSSFLSGGVTTSAGRLVVHDGILEAIWPYSGHYLPTEDNFKEFISFLEENHVDLSKVKRCSLDDDSVSHSKHIVTTVEEDSIEESSEIVVDVPDVKASIDTSNINATQLDLTRALSCKWASGVGARIGCVRDYPVELQTQALEKVNLSPSSNPSPPYSKKGSPIPSPRPGLTVRVSPRLSRMGIPSPRVSPSIANRF